MIRGRSEEWDSVVGHESDQGARHMPSWRPSLAGQFSLVSLVVLLTGMVIIGAWVSRQIEEGVLSRTSAITGLYVDSIVAPHLQTLAAKPTLSPLQVEALDRLLSATGLGTRIVAFKVWSPTGEVLYSANPSLIGRTFATTGGLAQALEGQVAASLSDLSSPENEYERQGWSRLVEVYVPIYEMGGDRVVAVTEFYQLPDELDKAIDDARRGSWLVVAAATVVMYMLLAGIVRRGSNTISRQRTLLHQQVAELSGLLQRNARLHARLRQAAGRTTALNEQVLRRISADLHDGPGQALGLALLRLDALHEPRNEDASDTLDTVQTALQDALKEIRSISAGLRLPELSLLSLDDTIGRVVGMHEHLTGTTVALELQGIPTEAPLPLKIALFRSLQEALSNASRHGDGKELAVRVWTQDDELHLAVSDRGPGFSHDPSAVQGRLGIAGMRERAELLGGSFHIESVVGSGTTVHLTWPLDQEDDQ